MIANIKKIQIFLNKYEVLPQQSLKVTKGCDFPIGSTLKQCNSKDEESQLNLDQDY